MLNEPNGVSLTVITMNTTNATLDLNGFEIAGPTECTGTPVSTCSPTSTTGVGILVGTAMGLEVDTGMQIRNGTIRGMGLAGLVCQVDCIVENIIVIENGATGISTGNGNGFVRHSVARRNGGTGMFIFGRIEDSISFGNMDKGIQGGNLTIIKRNLVEENGSVGIDCRGCQLIENVVRDNTGVGVDYTQGGGLSAIAGGNIISNGGGGTINGSPAVESAPNLCGDIAC